VSNPRHDYVRQVIDIYLWLPGTTRKASRRDRALAGALYDRGVPLQDIRAALLLAAARRAFRDPQAPTLPPVRTLYYFLPALEEVRQERPEPRLPRLPDG
jgi:hypothetical protein